MERVKNIIHVGIDASPSVFVDEEPAQFLIIGLFEFLIEVGGPIVMKNLHANPPASFFPLYHIPLNAGFAYVHPC